MPVNSMVSVVSPFTEEDLTSGVAKLVNSAMRYSRRTCGMQGLKGFEVGSMNPNEFRLQLYRTFDMTVGTQVASHLSFPILLLSFLLFSFLLLLLLLLLTTTTTNTATNTATAAAAAAAF